MMLIKVFDIGLDDTDKSFLSSTGDATARNGQRRKNL